MSHYELPDVNELWEGVALLHDNLLGPLDPRWVLVIARGQPPRQRGSQYVERLTEHGVWFELSKVRGAEVREQWDGIEATCWL